MTFKFEDSTTEGDRILERLELIGAAAVYLRRCSEIPVALLFRLYGVRRLDTMSVEQLLDFIERGKRGQIPFKRDPLENAARS